MATREEREFEVIMRARRDLIEASKTLSDTEARFLVDSYYQGQDGRIRAQGQIRSMLGDEENPGEPHATLSWFLAQFEIMEKNMERALDVYSNSREIGRWARSICGIGSRLSAGLMAHVDVRVTDQVSRLWAFAGYDPSVRWFKREEAEKLVKEVHAAFGNPKQLERAHLDAIATRAGRKLDGIEKRATERGTKEATWKTVTAALAARPWNAQLKVHCWRIGQSFVKVQNNKNDYYGKVYVQRKAFEQLCNARGDYRDQAAKALSAKRYRGDTIAKKCYENGQLPPAHIDARARRYAVKFFLSHWHEVARECEGLPRNKPYLFRSDHAAGKHVYIPPPNWPMAREAA